MTNRAPPTDEKPDKGEAPERGWMGRHLHQHHRFYAGMIAAGIAYFAVPTDSLAVRLLSAADAFFVVYLVLLAIFAGRATPETTMKYARVEDEGLTLIAALTMAAVGVSLTSIIFVLTNVDTMQTWALVIAALSVPLGWMTVHSSIALHYARLYYAEEEDGGSREGLDFPCDDEPDVLDFLYFSFVLGMTAQTSDVQITGRRVRRSVLVHSIISFFYNTVIVALTVNAAVAGLGG